jgi:uncharacterized Zn finger protein
MGKIHAAKLAAKENRKASPVVLSGRQIAATFWGKAWCENLEAYSDFANRLPRGRTYIRNGSVVDLVIGEGEVRALVAGSEVYKIKIEIEPLAKRLWNRVKADCTGSIESLMDLLQARFDEGVMRRLTQRDGGLFPHPREISMKCSCPDWATMCKHIAAVLYGVGSRLDSEPELFFTLRCVDHLELVQQAVAAENLEKSLTAGSPAELAQQDLGAIFGIDLDVSHEPAAPLASNEPTKRSRKKSLAGSGPIAAPEPSAGKPKENRRTRPRLSSQAKTSLSRGMKNRVRSGEHANKSAKRRRKVVAV